MTREKAEEYAKKMTYRDAVYNALQGKCIPYRKATLIKLYELLDKLPSVTPTRKKGKWIKLRDRYDEPYEVCSLCNCSGIGVFNYCPNCGAEMESE